MKSQSMKVLLAAVVSYLGAYIANYISKIPPPPPTYSVMTCIGEPWSVWNYLSLVSMIFALGLTIAGIKLMRH
jgi:hypothetical protein